MIVLVNEMVNCNFWIKKNRTEKWNKGSCVGVGEGGGSS